MEFYSNPYVTTDVKFKHRRNEALNLNPTTVQTAVGRACWEGDRQNIFVHMLGRPKEC
jgi:hypothetical protein